MFSYHFSFSPHQTQPRPSTWILKSVRLLIGTGGHSVNLDNHWAGVVFWYSCHLQHACNIIVGCCLFCFSSCPMRGMYSGWTEVMCVSWSCRRWPQHTCTTEAGSLITCSSPWLSREYHQRSWKRICENFFVWCFQWCQMSYMSHAWPLAFCLNFSGLYHLLPCSM